MQSAKILILEILLLMIAIVPFNSVRADHSLEPCAPEREPERALHVAWINCLGNDEVLVVFNGTDKILDLAGFRIRGDKKEFLFESAGINFSCCAVGAYDVVRIHSGPENSRALGDPRDLHWLTDEGEAFVSNLWNDMGDRAELLDPQGNVVDEYHYEN